MAVDNSVDITFNGSRFCIWNSNGLVGNIGELEEFIKRLDVHFMLISETHANNRSGLTIPGYSLYATHRITHRGGGTAIYVRHGIDHSAIVAPDTDKLEITQVVAKIGGRKVKISSIYQPPNKFVARDYESLFEDDVPHVIGGDFNAKHPFWHSRLYNNCGRQLFKLVQESPLDLKFASQSQPTHYHHAGFRPDILDFYVLNKIDCQTDVWTRSELSSDHNPVVLDMHSSLNVDLDEDDRHCRLEHSSIGTARIASCSPCD